MMQLRPHLNLAIKCKTVWSGMLLLIAMALGIKAILRSERSVLVQSLHSFRIRELFSSVGR